MPRQAARLVLGRSARARPATSSYQSFSTTPRHFNDNDANSGSRRDRSAAAASALGAMGSSSRTPSSFGNNGFSSAPNLGRPGSNIISMRSLPQARRAARLGGSGDAPAPGTPGFVPRFAGRGGGFAGRGRGGALRGGLGRGGLGRGRGRGRFGRGRGRGRGSGSGGDGRGGRGSGVASEEAEEDELLEDAGRRLGEILLEAKAADLNDEIQDYAQDIKVHGPERQYIPSTTLESLVQWGPAVATNNALGQSAMAIRNMRLLAGGRTFHENEQSFDILDEARWRSMNKPIFYSRVEQKVAALRMLNPEKRERQVQKNIDSIVKSLQETHGQNWEAFARAYDKLGEENIRRIAEKRADDNLSWHANDLKMVTTKNKTTRQAISKFVLKGDHPEVKDAEDIHGKAARYHAQTPTYRPADGAKFDEKLKQLIRS